MRSSAGRAGLPALTPRVASGWATQAPTPPLGLRQKDAPGAPLAVAACVDKKREEGRWRSSGDGRPPLFSHPSAPNPGGDLRAGTLTTARRPTFAQSIHRHTRRSVRSRVVRRLARRGAGSARQRCPNASNSEPGPKSAGASIVVSWTRPFGYLSATGHCTAGSVIGNLLRRLTAFELESRVSK